MRPPLLMLGTLLAVSTTCCAAVSKSRAADTGNAYLTRSALLYTLNGSAPVADWGQLPFKDRVTQVAVSPFGSRSVLVLTAAGQLFDVSATPARNSRGATVAGVSVTGPGLNLKGTVLRRPSSGFAKASGEGSVPQLSFANSGGVFRCKVTSGVSLELACTMVAAAAWPSSVEVNDVVETLQGEVWIATGDGLYHLTSHNVTSKLEKVPEVTTGCTAAAFDDATGVIAAGSNWLWRRLPDSSSETGFKWHYFITPGIIDANVTALEFDMDGVLWIANAVCVNKQDTDLGFNRVGGLEGLPVGNLTSLALSPSGAMWLGSVFGALRYLPTSRRDARDFQNSEWQYFYGPRWLPSASFDIGMQSVLGLSAFLDHEGGSQEGAVVVTAKGISVIEYFLTSLEEKAEHYQRIAEARHDRPPGFSSDVGLHSFGNVSSFYYRSSDNDGLWTSVYTASQCFKYAVTKDPSVKREAWHRFEALEFLNNVTGIRGLMARSALHAANPPPGTGGVWHNSTTYPGWVWKGDTSSDEVAGHLFIYPLVHDLVAETPEEKARVLRLVDDITRYIQKNDWMLIDITGKRTSWGCWSPKVLNHDQDWYDERGLNSLQILSWLLSAHRLTGDDYFMKGLRDLVDNYGYGINMINQKITQPDDDNYSDDELAYLPYYTWIHANSSALKAEFSASINRAHRVNGPERSDLWNTIYAAFKKSMSDQERQDVLWTLRDWTWSLVDWPTQNSNRMDIRFNPDADRFDRQKDQSVRVLPYNERTMLRWNSNPHQLDGGSGFSETDPGAWLLPYWMARYHDFI